ncbi:MAG TPA: dephospho-CoA kinase [Planctomycetota bacterium]|nr:dephospho-CoA kinase [Planctomycetota bacterium]
MTGGRRPVAVAITGGIGAGKSEALRAFARHGAAVISSDEIVHRLLREDADVKAAIVGRFGEDVLGPDGEIDRSRVGKIVFGDRGELAWLESLLHPRVSAEYLRWRDELAELPDPPAVCATEVPLLYETGAEERFDAVVAITASTAVRTSRTIRPDVNLREQRLIADEEKLRRADFAYVNEGSLEELDAFVAGVMAKLSSWRAEREGSSRAV